MATYQVTARLVQVRKQDGSYAHVYEQGLLPDDADPAHVEQLVASEMVVAVGSADTSDSKRGARSADAK